MDKVERIKSEQDRLFSIFADLDENELEVAGGLISQASFMLVTLEDLQETINAKGLVGEYKNGDNQYGTKQSAELQAYNQTLRSYNAVIGKLLKIVPRKTVQRESALDRWKKEHENKEPDIMTPEEYDEWHKDFCEKVRALEEGRDTADD